MNTHTMKSWILAVALAAGAASACGGGGDGGEPTLEEDACEHLQETASTAVTASLSSNGAPAIDSDHVRYDVTLVANTAGWVSYASAEAADYAFFLDADVPVAFFDGSGTALPVEASGTTSTACAEIAASHLLEVPVGTVNVRLGPTTVAEVGIVVLEAAHEDAH